MRMLPRKILDQPLRRETHVSAERVLGMTPEPVRDPSTLRALPKSGVWPDGALPPPGPELASR